MIELSLKIAIISHKKIVRKSLVTLAREVSLLLGKCSADAACVPPFVIEA